MTKRMTFAALLAVATLGLNAQKPMTAPKGKAKTMYPSV